MIRLSANLSFLFTERPFLDRFEAAARAGFKAVEYMFPYEFDCEAIRLRLDEYRLQQVLFNLPAGDWTAGERGIACHPGREQEFLAGLRQALLLAKKLGVRHLNCLAGLKPKSFSEDACRKTFIANLRLAAEMAAAEDVQLLIEPINSRIDMPGFWLDTPTKAMALIEEISHGNVFLQYDVYHAHVMGEEVLTGLQAVLPSVRHIQIADHPGRHQPGTGEIPFGALFELLSDRAYQGWVGCEYRPSAESASSFDWAEGFLNRTAT